MEKVNIKVEKAAADCSVKKVEASIKGAGNGTTGGIRPIDPIVVPKKPIKPINPGIPGGERALRDSIKNKR